MILIRRISYVSCLILGGFGFISMALFGCSSKLQNRQVTPVAASSVDSPNKKVIDKNQSLAPTQNGYDSLPEKEKEKYEPPAKVVKVGNKYVLLRGHTKFENVVYTFNSKNKTIEITGQLKMVDVPSIPETDEYKFTLEGKVEEENQTVILKSKDIDKRSSKKLKLGASILCIDLNNDDIPDCEQSIVDFIVQIKESHYTDQFKTVALKNSIEDRKNKRKKDQKKIAEQKAPAPAAPAPGPVPTPAPTPETPQNTTPVPVETEKPEPLAPDQIGQQGEGHDESLDANFNSLVDSEDIIQEIFDDSPTSDKKDEDKVPSDTKKPAAPPVKKPKIIKGILTTLDGIPRPVDQAIAYADSGELRRSTDLVLQQKQLKEDKYYNVAFPNRMKYFATYEMAQLISGLGQFTTSTFGNRLMVSNISLKNGGFSPPHRSHQNGTDADFGYPRPDDDEIFPVVVSGKKLYRNNYSPERTLKMLEFAFSQTASPIDRIFIDQLIINDLCKVAQAENLFEGEKESFWRNVFKTIQHVDGHGDHMHVRIKCSANQRLCQPKIYVRVNHCQN